MGGGWRDGPRRYNRLAAAEVKDVYFDGVSGSDHAVPLALLVVGDVAIMGFRMMRSYGRMMYGPGKQSYEFKPLQ